MTTPTPDRLWAVRVTIPAHIDEDSRLHLFDVIADAAHDWEPKDRDGWDIDVSAAPVADPTCPYVVTDDEGTSHCTLAESCADGGSHRGAVLSLRHQRDRLAAEVAALRTQLDEARNPGIDMTEAKAAVRRALAEDTPDTPTEPRWTVVDAYQKVRDEHGTFGAIHSLLALADENGQSLRSALLATLTGAAEDRTTPSPDTPPVCATCNDTRTVMAIPFTTSGPAVPCPDCTEDTPDDDL